LKTIGLLEAERIGNTLVLTPGGGLKDFNSDELLQGDPAGTLAKMESGDAINVVVDCSGVSVFCSAGFAYLIRLWKKTRKRGGRVVLCNVSSPLSEAIDVLHLGRLWSIAPTLDAAMSDVEL
jgi:anti-anti-sigma factor